MSMTTITREGFFEYAHRLMHHPDKCATLHGHSGKYHVEIHGPVDSKTGMIMDFSDLKKILAAVEEGMDHVLFLNKEDPLVQVLKSCWLTLNMVLTEGEPTAENLARFLHNQVQNQLPEGLRVVSVQVWETAKNSATFRPGV